MSSTSPEIITNPTTMLPSPDEGQHSEGAYTPPEVTQKRIERLIKNIQTNKKPYRILDLSAYNPDETGTRSFDQIVLSAESERLMGGRSKSGIDGADHTWSTTPERIVKMQDEVDGAPVRGNSAHGVIFLKLGALRGQPINVAVKVFSSPSKAFTEYVNTLTIKDRGIDTLEPVAVIADKGTGVKNPKPTVLSKIVDNPIGFYISVMEPIRSIDRLRVIRNGYRNLVEGDESHSSYLDYLSRMGEIMADMHLRGIFPGDSQIKNFAIKQDGNVIPIDFENTDIFNLDFFATNPERFAELSRQGMSVLFRSLTGQTIPPINFYNGYSGEGLWHVFQDTILTPYANRFEELVLAKADAKQLSTDQFGKALDSLETIKAGVKDEVMRFKYGPQKH